MIINVAPSSNLLYLPRWRMWLIGWRLKRKKRAALKAGRQFTEDLSFEVRGINYSLAWMGRLTISVENQRLLREFLEKHLNRHGLGVGEMWGNYSTLEPVRDPRTGHINSTRVTAEIL